MNHLLLQLLGAAIAGFMGAWATSVLIAYQYEEDNNRRPFILFGIFLFMLAFFIIKL